MLLKLLSLLKLLKLLWLQKLLKLDEAAETVETFDTAEGIFLFFYIHGFLWGWGRLPDPINLYFITLSILLETCY